MNRRNTLQAAAQVAAIITIFHAGAASAQSINEVMGGLHALADGSYARSVERERAAQPVVNRTPAQFDANARATVLSELRDASSAKFRNVQRYPREDGAMLYCGEINARNGYGGMSGYGRFMVNAWRQGARGASFEADPDFEVLWSRFCNRSGGVPINF